MEPNCMSKFFDFITFFQKYQVWLDLDWIGADDLWIIILKLKCLIVLLIKTCLSKYFESSKNRENWENSNSRISRSQVPNWVSSSYSIKSELAYQFFEMPPRNILLKCYACNPFKVSESLFLISIAILFFELFQIKFMVF